MASKYFEVKSAKFISGDTKGATVTNRAQENKINALLHSFEKKISIWLVKFWLVKNFG